MYSWEITNKLTEFNYKIDADYYAFICRTSPQITSVDYNPNTKKYILHTDDKYAWEFEINREENKVR